MPRRTRLPKDRSAPVWVVWSARAHWCGHLHLSRAKAEDCLKAVHRKQTKAHAVYSLGSIDRRERCIFSFPASKASPDEQRDEAIEGCLETAKRCEELVVAADRARAAASRSGQQSDALEANALRTASVHALQGHKVDFERLAREAPSFWS